jgi:hypothetical protein
MYYIRIILYFNNNIIITYSFINFNEFYIEDAFPVELYKSKLYRVKIN